MSKTTTTVNLTDLQVEAMRRYGFVFNTHWPNQYGGDLETLKATKTLLDEFYEENAKSLAEAEIGYEISVAKMYRRALNAARKRFQDAIDWIVKHDADRLVEEQRQAERHAKIEAALRELWGEDHEELEDGSHADDSIKLGILKQKDMEVLDPDTVATELEQALKPVVTKVLAQARLAAGRTSIKKAEAIAMAKALDYDEETTAWVSKNAVREGLYEVENVGWEFDRIVRSTIEEFLSVSRA